MNQSFSKIWIVIVILAVIGGGIFAWQYFGAPEEEIGGVGKDGCIITGCSGQICSDERAITTCEYLPQYACYKNAVCERQSNGKCGWTQTSELTQCLLQAKSTKRVLLDISNWQTYRNDEFGFEVKYPDSWTVIEGPKELTVFNDERGEPFISLAFANRAVIGISFCGAYPEDKRCEVLETADARFMIDWGLDKEAVAETDINADVAMFVTLHQVTTPAKNIFEQILSTFRFIE